MGQQYIRIAQLFVGNVTGNNYRDLSQLHLKFHVKRGDNATPNSCTVRAYNVSPDTAAFLQGLPNSQFKQLSLQCGYLGRVPLQSNPATIFFGNIKYVNTGHENAVDSYVDIVAADGDAAYNYAVVSTTLAAGSKATDRVKVCTDAMANVTPGVTPGYISEAINGPPLPRGKTMWGLARDHMRLIASSQFASWNIQDGQVQTLSINEYLPSEYVVLNSATGLIGYPQKTINGILVKTLLNPQIKINTLIQIDNSQVQGFNYSLNVNDQGTQNQLIQLAQLKNGDDGFYRVLWTEHTGDTRGNEWYSDLICVAVDVEYNGINSANFHIAQDELVAIAPHENN